MANIALVTYDAAHNAVTSCRDALVAGGHTVDLIQQTTALTTDFAAYDIIVTSRTHVTGSADLATKLEAENNAGKPLILGPLEAAQTEVVSTTDNLLVDMGLASAIAVADNQTVIAVGSPEDHEIRGAVSVGNNNLFATLNWVASLASGASYVGTRFMAGTADNVNGLAVAIAIGTDTARLTSGTTGARIVVFPTYLLSGAYTADHQTLLNNSVDWALASAAFNIALVSGPDTTNGITTNYYNALVALGHTVTLFTDAAAITDGLASYDLVTTIRSDPTQRASLAALLFSLNQDGKPLIIGTLDSDAVNGSSKAALSTELGLTPNITAQSGQTHVELFAHDILGDITPGQKAGFYSNSWIGYYNSVTHGIGDNFAARYASDATAAIGQAVESGTTRPGTADVYGNRIVVFPNYVSSSTYTAIHQELLGNAVDWAMAGMATVPPGPVEVSKLVAYAVMDVPPESVLASKVVAYAVMDLEHAQVYSSKLVGYAVMSEAASAPKVGELLGYQGDTWENDPTSYIHQWNRDGVPISGATEATYRLVAADEGTMISHTLIAVNSAGQSDPVTSEAVGPIEPADVVMPDLPNPNIVSWQRGDLLEGDDLSAVAQWNDVSGNDNHFAHGVAGEQPVLSAAALDGKNVIKVSRLDKQKLTAVQEFMTGRVSGSIIALVKGDLDPGNSSSTTGTGAPFYSSTIPDSTGSANHYPYSDGFVYSSFGSDVRKVLGNPATSLDGWHLVMFESAAGLFRCLLNGVQFYSTSTNTVGFANTRISSGGWRSGVEFFWDGLIAEIMWIDGVLSQAEREELEGHIAHRWGQQALLPEGHPYKNAAPGEDAYFNNVVLLSGFDTAIVDESSYARTLSPYGNARLDAVQSKFGGSSLYLDGAGDLLEAVSTPELQFGAGQFTVEAWVYYQTYSSNDRGILAKGGSGTTEWVLSGTSTQGEIFFGYTTDGSTFTFIVTSGAAIVTGRWYHVVADRDASGVIRVYVDGVMLAKATANVTIHSSTGPLHVGSQYSGLVPMNGWLDEVRLTKGVARYASDAGLTVPTAPYPRVGPEFTPLVFDGLSGITGAWSFSRKMLTAYGDPLYDEVSGAISAVRDQSGNARNLSQATEIAKPTILNAGPNNRPSANFVRANSQRLNSDLAISNFIANNSGYMVAAILPGPAVSVGSPYTLPTILGDHGGYVSMNVGQGNYTAPLPNNTPAFFACNWDGSSDVVGQSVTMEQVMIVEWRHEGGQLYQRINGGGETAVASGNTQNVNGLFYMGFGYSAGSYYGGQIFEAATFNVVPSQADRDAIVTNMMNYYGVGS